MANPTSALAISLPPIKQVKPISNPERIAFSAGMVKVTAQNKT
jgi:hypothetical protein